MLEKKTSLSVLTKGIIKENPVFVLILGTCPSLAVSTIAVNALGMGIAVTIVLIISNMIISLVKNIIPDTVRIPCYIVLIAGIVSVVQMFVKAYTPEINESLGIFLPLIAVNCIILGRAEMFANKNSVWFSALDGLGMGLGFTLALLILGVIREIIGFGTFFGIQVVPAAIEPMMIFVLAPGGFFVYGCIIALVNRLSRHKAVKRKSFGCGGCPSAGACQGAGDGTACAGGEG